MRDTHRSRVSRIPPWAKGRRQTAEPPRDPNKQNLKKNLAWFCLRQYPLKMFQGKLKKNGNILSILIFNLKKSLLALFRGRPFLVQHKISLHKAIFRIGNKTIQHVNT